MADREQLITLTADIIAAYVSNNTVAVGDVGALVSKVHDALAGLGNDAPAELEKPKAAIGIRASIKPDYLVSMIDGRPYKMLRRHLSQNGYTPEMYRETFGLPRDYPMVASSYAEKRRELAIKSGLGTKGGRNRKTPRKAG